jgi:hypothetical protein
MIPIDKKNDQKGGHQKTIKNQKLENVVLVEKSSQSQKQGKTLHPPITPGNGLAAMAETEQARLNESVPKKKAIRHEKKIESFGMPAAQLTDAGGSPAGSSHYQEPLPF